MLENRSHVNTIFFRFSTSTFFLPPPFRRDRSQKSEASLREGSGYSGLDVKMAFTNSCCAKLRGLPFDATEEAVREFLKPFEPHGLFLAGGRSGEAYADFGTNDQAVAVVKGKNKQYLGSRYFNHSLAIPLCSLCISVSMFYCAFVLKTSLLH